MNMHSCHRRQGFSFCSRTHPLYYALDALQVATTVACTRTCHALPDVRLSSTLGCAYATIIISPETYCLQPDLLMCHWGLLPAPPPPPCRLWLSCRLHLCTWHCITEEPTANKLSCNVSFGASACTHASCGSTFGCASATGCIPTGWLPLRTASVPARLWP